MGNAESVPEGGPDRGFPGSALLDSIQCGSLQDTEGSPEAGFGGSDYTDQYETFRKDADDDESDELDSSGNYRKPTASSPANPTSALFARALVNEVTDNPKTMRPAAMAEREKKLLKAQERARSAGDDSKAVGAPGGIGQPSVLGSIAHALTGTTDPLGTGSGLSGSDDQKASVLPPNSMSENRAQVDSNIPEQAPGKHTVTIGLSLSRRSSSGHPDTVTRQTAFDFNELQDREYKYVSNTDSSGWRAGGGERGGPQVPTDTDDDDAFGSPAFSPSPMKKVEPGTPSGKETHKVAAPDTVHIPIIHIDADSPQAVDDIIAALARGEVFIPHMAIIPETLSVNGVSPPDLVVRFGTERNDDLPPDEWPNWCLEFMHNQLYEYFHSMGARWMKRPFSITLARKVRWKTVKHMNRYFAHAERVIDAWREKGPQYLDPQLAYIEGGATPEEVARPHGIYLLRNGVPTNYFAPNFDPPYTTKMTRSLLLNVLGKSWDKKRREWTSEPIPRLITPAMLVSAMCGCSDGNAGGFIASEVTIANKIDTSTIPQDGIIRSEAFTPTRKKKAQQKQRPEPPQQSPMLQPVVADEPADTDIVSDVVQNLKDPGSRGLQMQPQLQPMAQHQKKRPEKLSLENLSMEDEERNETPVGPGDHEVEDTPQSLASPQSSSVFSGDGMKSAVSKQSTMSLEEEMKQLDDNLDLNVSASAETASKSQISAASSKYGRAPTPERHVSSKVMAPSSISDTHDRGSQPSSDDFVAAARDTKTENKAADVTASSDFVQPSVTGTNSTIMHMNLSTQAFVKRELQRHGREEKKEEEVARASKNPKSLNVSTLASDEDWLDAMGKPVKTPTPSSNKKKMTKAEIDRERERQIALIAIAQDQTSRTKGQDQVSKATHDQEKVGLARAAAQEQKGNKTRQQGAPAIQKADSGVSLEYSVDSTFMGGDNSTVGGSTLMGQHYATDASVATASTKGSKQTKTLRADAADTTTTTATSSDGQSATASKQNDEEELSAFSHRSGDSDSEVIPSDEELFSVGWAKALDPKSGSYYYFTLDRSKIVWDNPLASSHSMDEIPPTAGSI